MQGCLGVHMDVDSLGWEVLEGIGGRLGAGQSLFQKLFLVISYMNMFY